MYFLLICKVSIPQGTIKRIAIVAYLIFILVSIPQGTIKSYYIRTARGKQIKFQFHKVRLKVIDSGLIASDDGLFQFHKVRLKGGGASLLNSLFSSFQFHKVRLKVKRSNRSRV